MKKLRLTAELSVADCVDVSVLQTQLSGYLGRLLDCEGVSVSAPRTADDRIGQSLAESIPEKFGRDVVEFLVENDVGMALENLSRRQVVDYWSTWNDVQGWTREIVELVEALGWRLQ